MTPVDPAQPETRRFGPVLVFRRLSEGRLHVSALVGFAEGRQAPVLATREGAAPFTLLCRQDGFQVGRFDFDLPCDESPGHYSFDGRTIPVQTCFDGDLRLAFASCNGQEHGDFDRPEPARNALWARMGAEHAARPFALLLHGGDQIYADQDVRCHPLTRGWPDRLPADVTPGDLDDIARALRSAFVARYCQLFASEGYAHVAARIPSLAMWDDHDICDGWGSLERSRLNSAIGQTLFRTAREMFLLFQHAATEADIPALFHDPAGRSLGWRHSFPGFEVVAPDLRSERGRRQIMGPRGWAMMEELRDAPDLPPQVFMISSVPLLGPRLSLLEMLLVLIPSMQKYEDDLRDQWQSRAHRAEWQRMLGLCLSVLRRASMTVLSGEIHLATQARMRGEGGRDLIQLIASGIAHDAPPPGYARALGLLAGLGEAPLPRHPIRILPLPGQTRRYVAQRNYLVLQRVEGRWQAEWELEVSGRTPPLAL
jgi:hypothetical protein